MRARAVLVAMVAVVVVLAAACGDGGGETVASGDLPALPTGEGGGGGATASAMRASASLAAADEALAPGGPTGPVEVVTYRLAQAVTGLGGKAAAYRVPADVDGAAVAALAERLGVGRDDVEVQAEAGVPWSYGGDLTVSSTAVASPDGCEPPPPPDCGPNAVCATACVPPPPAPPPDLPSREEAERIAARVLGDGYEVSVEDEAMSDGWFATGTVTVGGVEVLGLEGGVVIGSKGKVVYAHGYLAQPEKLGDYPLVGRDEAQKRLDEFGGGAVAIASDAAGAREPATGAPEPAMDEPARDEPAPSPPSTIERTVELTSATVVLEFVPGFCSGDAGFLVPAYELAPEELFVPAVDDRALGDRGEGEKGEPCPGEEPGQSEPAVEPDGAPVPEPAPAPDAPVGSTEGTRGRADSGEADPGR